LKESKLGSYGLTFNIGAYDSAPLLINNGLEPLQRRATTNVTKNQDILGGSQEVVDSPMKIIGLAIMLQSIIEVGSITTINHGIQRADSTTETTKLDVLHLKQAIFVAVVVGPLKVGE
jgi:hypothetical protein